MKRASFIALFVAVLFLLPMLTQVGDPTIVESSVITPMRKTSTNAEGGLPYSGSGAARTATLKGLVTNETAGPLHIDSASSGFGSVGLPVGWTGTDLRVDIPHSSMWLDNDPINNDLDDYHTERWLDAGYDGETLQVPDNWTLIKLDPSSSGHPEHGVFEMNSYSSNGVGGSRGWRFDAQYSASDTLASTDEIYFSQMINIPRRALYSVHITFLYNVTINTDLQNQTYVFVRLGDYETKLYVHESGRTRNAWLVGDVVIPWSAYENVTTPESLPFDIGIGTDLSGIQASGYDSFTYIDDVYLDFEVSPFPEQVNLKANNTAIGGMTPGSVSPYVPVSVNRDCTDNPTTGIDLNGIFNDGRLAIAATGTGYASWESGFQFPLSIPQGAIITSAYVEVESATTASNLVDMRVHASDEDTVAAFTTGTPHLEDRFDWVNTSIDWDITQWTANSRYSSPDITRLVQKVVSRSGWSTGNYICIMLEYMYSSSYDQPLYIKGSSDYVEADLARLYVNYMIPQEDTVSLSGSWSGSNTVTVEFTTNSSADVMIEPSLYLNVTDTIDTLDNEQNTGTSFSVANNSLAYWTANVLISPPSGITDVNMSLSKASDWTFQNATDPNSADRSSAVTASSTELTMPSTAIDTYGIWTFVLSTTNGASNFQMGIGAGSYGSTAIFNVGDSAKFEGTAEIIGGSAMRLLLTDPSGQLFYASDDTTQGGSGDFEWTGITVTSTWDAGVWYADVNFNDTAGANPTEVGTYQRAFIVKHDTSLTLQSPGDAVSDQLSVRVAGEMLYVEVQLMDDDNSQVVTGATVTMNWTVSGSPSDVTLEDYGAGDYGVALNTSDLGDAKRWRIKIDSYHSYYNNATTYFDLDLFHGTELTYTSLTTTPIELDSTVTLVYRDAYDNAPIIGATIAFANGTLANVVAEGGGQYNLSVNTGSLGLGDHWYIFNASKPGSLVEMASTNITFTIRKHYTFVTVIGELVTPHGETTPVTVVITDLDTGAELSSTSSITSWSFTSSYSPVTEAPPADFDVTLTTAAWSLGPETVTLSVVMGGIYENPSNYQFDVEIRKHYTSVSVTGGLITPHGQTTPITVMITDLDTGANLGITTDVSSWSFTSSYSSVIETTPTDFDVTLT
ncbi:MAG: hypothetical protein RTU09_08320, partial [Candidatus Thorarchaeota archaeon]